MTTGSEAGTTSGRRRRRGRTPGSAGRRLAPARGTVGELEFRRPAAGPDDVEVFTLESLYRRGIEHLLERPQRLQFYVVVMFTHGRGVHVVDFVEHEYDDHTLFFVAKGQVQQFRVDATSGGFVLVFTSDFLYRNSTEGHVSRSMAVFDHARSSPRWRLGAESRALFLELFQQLHREYTRPPDALAEEVLRHWARLLLLHAERMRRQERPDLAPEPIYRQYLALRELVQRELAGSRSVQHYARRLGTTARRLNHVTRLVLNKPAKAFIEEEVIHEAQRLLADATIPIKEVAYRLGFSEPTNWVKFFRRHTGESPAAFRARLEPGPPTAARRRSRSRAPAR